MQASRQPHRELGEVADRAVDRDRAAVLLRHNLVDLALHRGAAFNRETSNLDGRMGLI